MSGVHEPFTNAAAFGEQAHYPVVGKFRLKDWRQDVHAPVISAHPVQF